MRVIRVEKLNIKPAIVPNLKEIFTPCPLCGGTTDIDVQGNVLCHSCQQEWTITGKPVFNDESIGFQTVGVGLNSRLNSIRNPLIENIDLAGKLSR